MANHESMIREEKVKLGSDRSFGLVFAAVFGLIGAWQIWHQRQWGWYMLAAGLAFLATALFAPKLLSPLNHLWFRFGLLLHKVVNPIIMGLLFFGSILGLVLAILRQSPNAILRVAAGSLVRVFQGVPLVVVIFMIYFGIAGGGINVSPLMACSIGLSLFAGAFLGEIWRGAIQAIPAQQWEAADALGFTALERLRYAILPQAIRLSMPATIGFIVQLVKGTSVASMVGYVELMRAGQVVNGSTFDSFTVFGLVALIYLAINLPLSFLSKRLEQVKL